jgi:LCP family protein required for cell wall assembly
MGSSTRQKRWLLGGGVAVLLLIGAAGAFALATWGEVNRVSIDRPEESGSAAEAAGDDEGEDVGSDSAADETDENGDELPYIAPSGGLDVYLLVGSDSRENLDSVEGFGEFSGQRADVILALLRTESRTALLSLPRDLWIEGVCRNQETRINEMLEGCGPEMNGPTLLTLSVERLIGQRVDHFAMVDLAGFQEAVDAIGGYEICVDNPVRDQRANLELPAGCTNATGEQALAWLRSRRTQELTDDGWRTLPGMSDLARNERQREFMIEVMGRLGDFSSPQALTATARAVAPYVTVDSDLSLVSAVNLAWTMRGLDTGTVVELEVPVRYFTTEQGAAVLVATTPVDEIVREFLSPEVSSGDPAQAAG